MVINFLLLILLVVINGYQWLLVPILFMAINGFSGYFINNYWWLFY
jgi:hypothetical protein